MIARCHAQIYVGVVTYIGVYQLLSAYYPSTYCYKRMRLLARYYSISDSDAMAKSGMARTLVTKLLPTPLT